MLVHRMPTFIVQMLPPIVAVVANIFCTIARNPISTIMTNTTQSSTRSHASALVSAYSVALKNTLKSFDIVHVSILIEHARGTLGCARHDRSICHELPVVLVVETDLPDALASLGEDVFDSLGPLGENLLEIC